MYLYIDKGKYGHNTLYVAKSYRNSEGKNTRKIIEKLGTFEYSKRLLENYSFQIQDIYRACGYRYLEKSLGHKYTCAEILNGLKNIKFLKNSVGYFPAYTRNDFIDDLHCVFGLRTDFQIISHSDMKKIIAFSKRNFS